MDQSSELGPNCKVTWKKSLGFPSAFWKRVTTCRPSWEGSRNCGEDAVRNFWRLLFKWKKRVKGGGEFWGLSQMSVWAWPDVQTEESACSQGDLGTNYHTRLKGRAYFSKSLGGLEITDETKSEGLKRKREKGPEWVYRERGGARRHTTLI